MKLEGQMQCKYEENEFFSCTCELVTLHEFRPRTKVSSAISHMEDVKMLLTCCFVFVVSE
jgi:hypothetical protein